ncbi:hypothetical protein J6TS1_48300 [Siminovitchia terrae]|uniref:DUF2812 domain-containing protein n=1 Tax=Siminovitchia terrae TaxID=1914933 RepID=A0ABQ4L427_SIMTE|nr:DUF2812 domain-containing protein [Siminovitchia terrae]GIN92851.1 hypothetical protein J22TS1_39020 [Siminovitchia terrae]GIN98960.1 hypothetical protein J6TS1_48300 [Siminovitchia terrae]
MKKVVYRFYLDYENEENWINEMSAKGWHLEKFALGRFTFTKGKPGKYVYRNEFISEMKTKEKTEYFEFLSDSGIIVIHEFGGWVYIKKEANEGPFELFTDNDSHIAYYNRMMNFFIAIFFVNVFFGILNFNIMDDGKNLGYVKMTAGSLNIMVAFLLMFPIYKIIRRKKELEKQQQFFE